MKVEMIIPNMDNDGSDNAAVIERTVREMCAMFGGVTAYEANGFWVSDTGRLYKDAVTVLISAKTEDDELKRAAREIALRVLNETDQEAVFFSVGGKAEIIS